MQRQLLLLCISHERHKYFIPIRPCQNSLMGTFLNSCSFQREAAPCSSPTPAVGQSYVN